MLIVAVAVMAGGCIGWVSGPGKGRVLRTVVGSVLLGLAVAGISYVGLEPGWVYLVVFAGWLAICFVDLREHRIPDKLSWGSAVVGLVGLGVAAGLSGQWPQLFTAVAAAAVFGAVAVVWALLSPLGWGDVKLSVSLGLMSGFQGWGVAGMGAFGAVVIGGIWAVGLMVVGRRDPHSHFAMGPPWILGVVLGLLCSTLVTV